MITRQIYYKILSRLREKKPLIQVLIGPRQVGKTTIAQKIHDEWPGPKYMVTADNPSPPQASWIRFHWEQARQLSKDTLLVMDEIQKVRQWSEQIKILFDEERKNQKLKILLLGSSSLNLQKGLSESLAGRFECMFATHWSFGECAEAFGWDFETFLKFGGYPGASPFIEDEERWRQYILQSIIEPVLGKDIMAQQEIRKPALFRQTFEIAIQSPAQILTLHKIMGQLQDRGNVTTIKNYLELLEKCFLIRCLSKYSGSTISAKASSPKIIVMNTALLHAYQSVARLKNDPAWYGFVFESLVGSFLAQIPGHQLYYWREGIYEVDFVLKGPEGIRAIEIKSGLKAPHSKGLEEFSKRHKKAFCETWNFEKAVNFLKKPE